MSLITFASTVDSAPGASHSLTDTQMNDQVVLDGAVGATRALSSVDLNKVTIGANVTTSGAQTYAQPTLASSPTLTSTAGAITFTGAVTGGNQYSLSTDTSGGTEIDAGAGGLPGQGEHALTALNIQGPSTLVDTIYTTGDQTYTGPVTFGADPELLSDSGQIDASSSIDLGGAEVPIRGSGSLSGPISDGTLSLGSGSSSSGAPAYTMALSGDNTYAGGTFIHGAGSLVQFSSLGNFGAGSVTLDNGAGLKWAPGSTTDPSGLLKITGGGAAVFDTNGNNVTFANPLNEGGSAHDGTITKQGAGALTLTGDNAFDDPWQVTGGTLAVAGSLAGPVTVTGGGGLALTGQAGGHVTVDPSGTLTCLGGTLGDGLTNSGTATYAPAAPTAVSAAGGQGTASVSFTPGAARCSPLTGYEVTAEPGDIHASGTGSPITVSGLRSGTAYTFTVTATNLIGTSAPSVSASATTARIVKASISSPGSGHTYGLGEKVTTKFSCAGLVGGALASCQDSNGSASGTGRLNTSTPGRHSYVVTATASDGSTTTASISYEVRASNLFTVSKPLAHGGGLVTFTVKVPDAGTVRVLEKTTRGTLASATRFMKRATTLHFRLTLSKRERAQLGKGAIAASVTITFSPVGGNPRTLKRSGLRLKR